MTLIGIGGIDSVQDWEGTTSVFFEGAYDGELPEGLIDVVAVGVTATRVEVFQGSEEGDAAVEVTYIQEALYLSDDPDWAPGDDFALVPLSTESRRADYVVRLSTLDGYEDLDDVLEIDASVAVTRDVGAVAGGEEGSGGGGGVATMGVIVGISVFVGVLLLAAIVAGIARHRRGRHDDDWLGSNADKGRHDGGDHEESPPTFTLEYPTGRQQDVRAGSGSFGGGAGRPTGGADWSLPGDDNVKPQTSAQEYHPLNNYDVPPTSKGQDVRTASASSGDGAAQTTRVESKPSSTPSTPSTLSIAYGGGADHSLSDAGGTLVSRTRQTGLANLEEDLPTTTAAAPPGGSSNTIFSDDPTFDRAYEEMREVLLDVYAPAGRLGVIIDTPDDGAPVIHAIKEDSPIFDKVRVGDKLVAVDDEDVRAMTAVKVSKMISTKGNNPSRKFTIIRQERKT